jgi:hypothetical protein
MTSKKFFKRAGQWVLPVFFCASLAGCDLLEMLKPAAYQNKASGDGGAEPSNMKMMSPRERLGFYKWLVNEMQEQIFARPLKDRSDAGGWANVLSQRGSIEGVYHGFVLSTDYIGLESSKKPADVKALRFYGLEMALMDFPYATETDDKVQAAAAKYAQDNLNTNIFSLKKDLGERILHEAVKRKGDDEKLAAWYSGIVARWAKLDIPFGLPQRNDKDEVFHFNWAKENTLGMLEWELLNRAHRILNQLNGMAVPIPPPAAKPAAPPNPNAPLPKSANPAGM